LIGSLAWLLCVFSIVIPIVHVKARKVVRTHCVHNNFSLLLFDSDAKERRDDERTERSNSRRPTQDSSAFNLVENNADHLECRTVTNACAVKQHVEQEYKPREQTVVTAVIHFVLRLPTNNTNCKGSSRLEHSVPMSDGTPAPSVGHPTTNRANDTSNKCTSPGITFHASVRKQIAHEFWKRSREPNKRSERHDVQIRHDEVVLVPENDRLLQDFRLHLGWNQKVKASVRNNDRNHHEDKDSDD